MSSACSTRPRRRAARMPAATPVPRGPSVLTLYTAADLLTGPGCPVCRYAGEAADRYLAWFALEGHADVVTITRLCSSLGMCPRHTRGLMRQPGAASRLTAVYQYVMRAARDRLSGHAARLAICPGCGHDDGAADRALDTLLEGLAADSVRDRCRELGGLCVPHLRTASARETHRTLAWLSQTMTAAADSPACVVCLAAVRSEDDWLTRILRASDRGQPDGRLLLCGGHLGDAVALAGRRDAPSLLAWQAGCLGAGLARHHVPAGGPAGWLRTRRRRGGARDGCLVCQASEDAAQRAVDGLRASLRADMLIAELDEEFSKNTWAHRQEARGPEKNAWRRAAAFLDGAVFCGCPPRGT